MCGRGPRFVLVPVSAFVLPARSFCHCRRGEVPAAREETAGPLLCRRVASHVAISAVWLQLSHRRFGWSLPAVVQPLREPFEASLALQGGPLAPPARTVPFAMIAGRRLSTRGRRRLCSVTDGHAQPHTSEGAAPRRAAAAAGAQLAAGRVGPRRGFCLMCPPPAGVCLAEYRRRPPPGGVAHASGACAPAAVARRQSTPRPVPVV